MTVDEVLALWERDCKIDKTELGEESVRVEQLHQAYWKHLAQARRDLRDVEGELRQLRLAKTEWYTQGPSREDLPKGWKLPARGRVMKSEARDYVDADPDVVALGKRVGAAQDAVDALTDVLKMISARGYRIDGAIKDMLFKHGR